MKSPFALTLRWHTAWSGVDIVVLRNGAEVDRLHGPDIRRVVFVQPIDSTSAGELAFAVVELADDYVVVPADTGFAGRVHFERQAFWAGKGCTYWTDGITAPLPARCLARRGLSLRREPVYARVPRAELEPVVERWLLEGPQSWEERRWLSIERSRPFARIDTHASTRPGAVLSS